MAFPRRPEQQPEKAFEELNDYLIQIIERLTTVRYHLWNLHAAGNLPLAALNIDTEFLKSADTVSKTMLLDVDLLLL